jgi:hypothetical protein
MEPHHRLAGAASRRRQVERQRDAESVADASADHVVAMSLLRPQAARSVAASVPSSS